jgi:hypothetical protein
VVPALIILAWRHRPDHPDDDPPTIPGVATWGAPGRAVDFEPVDVADAIADVASDAAESAEGAAPAVAIGSPQAADAARPGPTPADASEPNA